MASLEMSRSLLKSKFRGCLAGALVGDCIGNQLGIAIEVDWRFYLNLNKNFDQKKEGSCQLFVPSRKRLNEFMSNIMNEELTEDRKVFHYTDDTTMTLDIVSSLIEKEELDVKDMAKKFVYAFFNQEIYRDYGTHVRRVFKKLKETEFEDVFLPAKEQFDGQGSFGNGAAMRISPIALFGNNKQEEYMMNAVKESSLITHYHPDGYRGAMLQCLAVNAALRSDPSHEFDSIKFIDGLLEKMKQIETEETKPYCDSLQRMKEIFVKNQEEYVTSEEIALSLGNGDDVSALKSVPTAIFSFLRGMKPFTNNKEAPRFVTAPECSFMTNPEKHYFESDNPFIRTLYFAISVGGDTDTIGSMACAIAGAYYGEDAIPDVIKKKCEGIDHIIALADELFDVTYKDK